MHRYEGRLSSGAPPPPSYCPSCVPSGSATHVLWALVCGCGGPARTVPFACVPCWGLRAAGML